MFKILQLIQSEVETDNNDVYVGDVEIQMQKVHFRITAIIDQHPKKAPLAAYRVGDHSLYHHSPLGVYRELFSEKYVQK